MSGSQHGGCRPGDKFASRELLARGECGAAVGEFFGSHPAIQRFRLWDNWTAEVFKGQAKRIRKGKKCQGSQSVRLCCMKGPLRL